MDIDILENSKFLFYKGILQIDKLLDYSQESITFNFWNPDNSLALSFRQELTRENIELINFNIETGFNHVCYLAYSDPDTFSMFYANSQQTATILERLCNSPIPIQRRFLAAMSSQFIIDDVDTTEINNNKKE